MINRYVYLGTTNRINDLICKIVNETSLSSEINLNNFLFVSWLVFDSEKLKLSVKTEAPLGEIVLVSDSGMIAICKQFSPKID